MVPAGSLHIGTQASFTLFCFVACGIEFAWADVQGSFEFGDTHGWVGMSRVSVLIFLHLCIIRWVPVCFGLMSKDHSACRLQCFLSSLDLGGHSS